MRDEKKIHHDGVITDIQGNRITVKIVQSSACHSCHANAHCPLTEQAEKFIDITQSASTFQCQDKVTVTLEEEKGWLALGFGYLFPFLIVLLTLIASSAVTENEMTAGIISISSLIPYYIALSFFKDRLKQQFQFRITKKE
jgi:positive regulator of sigma E activity